MTSKRKLNANSLAQMTGIFWSIVIFPVLQLQPVTNPVWKVCSDVIRRTFASFRVKPALRISALKLALVCSFSLGQSASGQTEDVVDVPDLVVITEAEKPETEQILDSQNQLAKRYKLLEEKLFLLYEFERDNNPMRSQILKRAFQRSQEQMTATQLQTIVELLSKEKLKDAEQRQKIVLSELEALLKLLESEDRGKRVRDEIRRHKEYLKEVERLLRMQKGVRAQTESRGDPKRLAQSQSRAADRTKKLSDEIRENEEAPADTEDTGSDNSNDNASDENDSSGKPNEDDDSQDPRKESDSERGKNPGETEPDEKKPGEQSNEDGSPNEGQPGNSQGQGQPGQPGESSSEPNDQQNSPQRNPVRQKIDQALERMRDAQEKLEKAKQNESIDDMRKAEEKLAEARRELEEILRQLREEEVGRTLAKLEARFRKMHERELRVFENTRKLEQTSDDDRNTDFEIRAGKLSVEQTSIATQAERALLLLKEDGSSVAFLETVGQMHQDMLQVSNRLSNAKTGRITLALEEEILETLEYLIQSLVVTQRDLEKMKSGSQPPGGGGAPGAQPLVDQLAEFKMLRGLQERIYKRHQRYSKLLNDPDDLIGNTEDPDLRNALERLADRQQRLTDIARDLVNEKNN